MWQYFRAPQKKHWWKSTTVIIVASPTYIYPENAQLVCPSRWCAAFVVKTTVPRCIPGGTRRFATKPCRKNTFVGLFLCHLARVLHAPQEADEAAEAAEEVWPGLGRGGVGGPLRALRQFHQHQVSVRVCVCVCVFEFFMSRRCQFPSWTLPLPMFTTLRTTAPAKCKISHCVSSWCSVLNSSGTFFLFRIGAGGATTRRRSGCWDRRSGCWSSRTSR